MKIAAITTTRGDRGQFLEQCKKLMKNQTRKLDFHFIIDYLPINDDIDLIDRFRLGIKLAKENNVDFVFIIEDDDYYPYNYIEKMMQFSNYDMIGCEQTIYYHLDQAASKLFVHPFRSSLFCTAFKLKAVTDFFYPPKTEPYLDIFLWQFACQKLNYYLITEPLAVGIKHNIGKRAGNGHLMKYTNLEGLKKYIDNRNIDFYLNLQNAR